MKIPLVLYVAQTAVLGRADRRISAAQWAAALDYLVRSRLAENPTSYYFCIHWRISRSSTALCCFVHTARFCMGHVIESDGRERIENRAAVDGSLPWEPDLTYKVSLCRWRRWRGEGVPMVLKQGQEPSIWETCVLESRVASLSTLCLWDNLCMFPGMTSLPNTFKFL